MLKEKLLAKIEPYTKQLMDRAIPVIKREAKKNAAKTAGDTAKKILKVGGVVLVCYAALDGRKTKLSYGSIPEIPYPIRITYNDSHNTYNYYRKDV